MDKRGAFLFVLRYHCYEYLFAHHFSMTQSRASLFTKLATVSAGCFLAAVGFLGTAHYAHAADTITTAKYLDMTGDGTVDVIQWTMDENVTACAYEAGDWTVSNAGTVGVGVLSLTCSGSNNILNINVSAVANKTGGLTDPIIAYTQAAGVADSVTLTSGAMTNKSSTATDGAAPYIMSGTYIDADQDGTVDGIQLATSADTGMICADYAVGDTSVGTAGTVGIVTGAGDGCFTNGTSAFTLLLGTAGTPNVTGGSTPPVITYTLPANGLQDAAVNKIVTRAALSLADGAAPVILSGAYLDANANGTVDAIRYTTSADTSMACGTYAVSDTAVAATGSIGLVVGAGDTCATNGTSTFTISLGTVGTTSVTGGTVASTVNYTFSSIGLGDGLSNRVPTKTTFTLADGAAPVVVSSSPANTAAGVTRSGAISLTFSEVIASLTTTLTGSVTLTNGGLTSSTVILSGTKVAGLNTLTIATAPDAAANAFNKFLSTGTTAITFTVVSSSSPTTSSPLTYIVQVTSPVATAAYNAGDAIPVVWNTSSGTGSPSAVNLSYSTDGGLTYTSIVTGTANDGSYSWTAPSISAASVTIKVEGTDLVTVLGFAQSDAFSIGSTGSTTTDTSTVDTSPTSTTLLPEGTVIKGTSWSTVYQIGADGTRRPFLDSQTFFSYYGSFDAVVTTSDEYLSNYNVGSPMLPKAGVVLVKVQSLNKVYALTDDSTLRWVTSESVATSLYGSAWADYVVDVPATAWGHFTVGADIVSASDLTVDRSVMQTRSALNSK